MTVVCDRFVKPNDPTFSGWIERVEKTPKIIKQLEDKSAEQETRWYSENSYWYDMLNSIPDNSNLWLEIAEEINN